MSLRKRDKNIGKWLTQQIGKLLIHFIFAFLIVISLMLIVFKNDLDIYTILINFVTLRLPGSTVWYFKIQILFYFILALSIAISKEKAWIFVLIASVSYAIVAKYVLNLQDFWWKTALSFPVGCIIAHYHDVLPKYTDKLWFRILVVFLGIFSYLLLLKDGHYRFYVQLPTYAIIAFTISMLWGWFVKENRSFSVIGKVTLDLYLIHIGIVEGVFLMNMDLNLRIILFVVLSAIFTIVNYILSENVYRGVFRLLQPVKNKG